MCMSVWVLMSLSLLWLLEVKAADPISSMRGPEVGKEEPEAFGPLTMVEAAVRRRYPLTTPLGRIDPKRGDGSVPLTPEPAEIEEFTSSTMGSEDILRYLFWLFCHLWDSYGFLEKIGAVAALYASKCVLCRIWSLLGQGEGQKPPSLIEDSGTDPESVVPGVRVAGAVHLDIQSPVCPKCQMNGTASEMVLRMHKGERHLFWGCSRFRTGLAHCDGTRNTKMNLCVRFV